jgi:hypothetical protein
MSHQELKELDTLIEKAMKVSAEKLLEQKKRLGQELVISENGIVKVIDAKDIK